MLRSVFTDSAIATKYHSASTKGSCMLNLAVAPTLKMALVDTMKSNPLSIGVDGSNDVGPLALPFLILPLFP